MMLLKKYIFGIILIALVVVASGMIYMKLRPKKLPPQPHRRSWAVRWRFNKLKP